MTFDVVFAESASDGLIAILDYIAQENPRRAATFVAELKLAIERRLVFPQSGQAIGKHRYIVFGNYVAVYQIEQSFGRVVVVLVTEGHRNWKNAFR